MSRLAGLGIVALGFVALAALRSTAPHYVDISGPVDIAGSPEKPVRADNLVVTAGQPILARTINFRANGKTETRESVGAWLVVPVVSNVERETAHILGRVWQTSDGRRYRSSARVETGDAVLSSIKTLQPGLERRDLVVFELPPELAAGGTLLLSEERDPQLTGEARIRYPAKLSAAPVATLDLDDLHAKL